MKSQKFKLYPCIRPWFSVTILWDGRVTLCCKEYDGKYILGDLSRGDTLKNVWNGKKIIALRKALIENKLSLEHPCTTCRDGEGYESSKIYPLDILLKINEIGLNRILNYIFRIGK